MLAFIKKWLDNQQEVITITNEENNLEKQHFNFNINSHITPILPQEFQFSQSEQNIKYQEQTFLQDAKLFIGFSCKCIKKKVLYLNYLMGSELFDEEFFKGPPCYLRILHNEVMMINGRQITTQQELKRLLKIYKKSYFINLEFPTYIHSMLEKKQQKKIIFLDNFGFEIKGFEKLQPAYEYLENINLQNKGFSLWISKKEARSDYGFGINQVTKQLVPAKDQVISFFNVFINTEYFSTKFVLTKIQKIKKNRKNRKNRKAGTNNRGKNFLSLKQNSKTKMEQIGSNNEKNINEFSLELAVLLSQESIISNNIDALNNRLLDFEQEILIQATKLNDIEINHTSNISQICSDEQYSNEEASRNQASYLENQIISSIAKECDIQEQDKDFD